MTPWLLIKDEADEANQLICGIEFTAPREKPNPQNAVFDSDVRSMLVEILRKTAEELG